jgi:hypothetical protein
VGTCWDGDLRGWTWVDVLPVDGMQEVRGSNPRSSTQVRAIIRNSDLKISGHDTAAKYSNGTCVTSRQAVRIQSPRGWPATARTAATTPGAHPGRADQAECLPSAPLYAGQAAGIRSHSMVPESAICLSLLPPCNRSGMVMLPELPARPARVSAALSPDRACPQLWSGIAARLPRRSATGAPATRRRCAGASRVRRRRHGGAGDGIEATSYHRPGGMPAVRGREKVPVCGQVEVSAGGQVKVPIPRSSCLPGGLRPGR